uniref:fasciclin domain-containing protein n=1 Tax=Deinococcus planocerae TaxID=1737569 RepID=UPI0011AFCE3B
MKKQTSLITLSLLLATPALAGGGGAPAARPATGGAACQPIAQLITNDPQFSTLLTAVQAAGLAETLSSGQYTVFAPTNAAFAKLPSDTLAAVLNDPEQLRAVLLYHVVPGKVTAQQVRGVRSVRTVQGGTLTVSVSGNAVRINNANVTRADINACNGVVHVIDAVLVPPAAAAP